VKNVFKFFFFENAQGVFRRGVTRIIHFSHKEKWEMVMTPTLLE
jgi:hypothetical protein